VRAGALLRSPRRIRIREAIRENSETQLQVKPSGLRAGSGFERQRIGLAIGPIYSGDTKDTYRVAGFYAPTGLTSGRLRTAFRAPASWLSKKRDMPCFSINQMCLRRNLERFSTSWIRMCAGVEPCLDTML